MLSICITAEEDNGTDFGILLGLIATIVPYPLLVPPYHRLLVMFHDVLGQLRGHLRWTLRFDCFQAAVKASSLSTRTFRLLRIDCDEHFNFLTRLIIYFARRVLDSIRVAPERQFSLTEGSS